MQPTIIVGEQTTDSHPLPSALQRTFKSKFYKASTSTYHQTAERNADTLTASSGPKHQSLLRTPDPVKFINGLLAPLVEPFGPSESFEHLSSIEVRCTWSLANPL